jgi:YD repeat-containing protein
LIGNVKFSGRTFLSSALCAVVLFCLGGALPARGGDAYYYYDKGGRLIMTLTDTGEVVTYEYDSSGNLLSVSGMEVSNSAPVIHSVSPGRLFAGTGVTVTITGEGLFSTRSVLFDDSSISVKDFSATETEITATVELSSASATGVSAFTVETVYGSASDSVGVYKVTLSPETTVMGVGEAVDITVVISPPEQVSLEVGNVYPEVLDVADSVAIPTSGEAVLEVSGIGEGTGYVTVKNATMAVYVPGPFSGDTWALSPPVSVAMPVDSWALSPSVSVAMPVDSWALSPSVSVYTGQ